MVQVVRSFNGAGRLAFANGDTMEGRYHVDVRYMPVRRLEQAQGSFVLDRTPAWDSVVEAIFAGEAKLVMMSGVEARVSPGGIVGKDVTIVSMEPIAPTEASAAGYIEKAGNRHETG